MRTETNGNIKVTLFDEVAYDREKNLVIIERLTSTPTWVEVSFLGIGMNRYYFDQTDKITIDWSDIIRSVESGELEIDAETSEYFHFDYTVKHGVMPMQTIEPPYVMWKADAQAIEVIHNNWFLLDALVDNVWVEVVASTLTYDGAILIPNGSTQVRYKLGFDGEVVEDIPYIYILLKNTFCTQRFVLIKWLSSYGNYKKQWFEVEDRTTESTERQEKATLTNNYSVLKNRVDSLTAIMRDISAHDIEYYSDLVTSNEVFILANGDDTVGEQVDVQTKKITIPNGVTQKYDFKIDINHRHYDLFLSKRN